MIEVKKYKNNPIISPNPNNPWESKATFNPGVVKIKDKIYLLYRAMSEDNTSTIGLAITEDGFTIEERLSYPIYIPREDFESKRKGKINTGCEDPRLVIFDDKIYMFYTAVADNIPFVRVAVTSIKIKDFLRRRWEKWERPKLISPPGVWDKDACIIRVKKNLYAFFHRIMIGKPGIWISFMRELDFNRWYRGREYIKVRENSWDSDRIGIAGPPIRTKEGWVLIYHGKSRFDGAYRLGAMLLDLENPSHVLKRLDYPILEPKEWYERQGLVNNVVFSCGHALVDDTLFIYYGASDTYTAVATLNFDDLLAELTKGI